jgi:hypothetical protein
MLKTGNSLSSEISQKLELAISLCFEICQKPELGSLLTKSNTRPT